MKIKAVKKNKFYDNQSYITVGKEYEVLEEYYTGFDICDDDGDCTFVLLEGSSHGFEFEVVQGEPEQKAPKFRVGDGPMPVVEPEDHFKELDNVNNPTQVKSDGGPSSYYDFPHGKDAWVTLNDMNDYKSVHQWGPLSFHMTNVNKATFRFGQKDGTSKVYDVNKIIYSGLRMKLMLENKEAVRKYLQQLLDDPQFQESTK